jgi:hypothetical protein
MPGILATQEGEMSRISRPARAKSLRNPILTNIPAAQTSTNRRISVQASSGLRPYLKNKQCEKKNAEKEWLK